ncbi:AAA family ATPase [Sulfobacillus thermosulfidooxidans]|uniref:AAA family ATPase n=1 Tax=Sulfobacillus thermosulfidooxidans TaxID=28034 RepID=UPI00031D3723|nr:P-loop NTPase [Sulfobacillus thermosulfidooxidans]
MSEAVIRLTARSQMPRLILAVGDPVNGVLADHLQGAFRIIHQVALLDALETLVQDEQPDVLLLSRHLPGTQDVRHILGKLRKAAPACRITLLLGSMDPGAHQLVQLAAQYGIYNIVPGDELQVEALTETLSTPRTWADIAHLLPEGIDVPPPVSAPSVSVAESASVDIPQQVTRYAKIVAVVSGKGGVGKSTFAANLLTLAQDVGAVGIDMDYAKPDLLLAFQPEDRQGVDLRDLLQTLNLPDSVEVLDRRDAAMVAEWVDKLPEVMSGITVIPGPSRDLVPQEVPTPVSAELLRYAAKKARLVVVDTAFEIADQATLDLLYAADVIMVVTTPDQQTVYQTAWLLEQLDMLRVPKGRLRLVVNKTGAKGLMSAREVAEKLGLPLTIAVPAEPGRYESARVTRKPVALREKSQGPLHRVMTQILKDVDDTPEKPRRGWFRSKGPSRRNPAGVR